jgi:hypothetical protein
MAHFAKVGQDGTVETVIVIADTDCAGGQFPSSEPIGQDFIASLGLEGEWKQTSYNHNFRKQYAPIGGKYDAIADVFVQRQPFPSWTLDSNHDWQPPVPKPDGWNNWDENSQSWIQAIVSEQGAS